MSEFMDEAEITILNIEQWLEGMRTNELIGQDIRNLQSFAPDGLSRVLLVAVISWKGFIEQRAKAEASKP